MKHLLTPFLFLIGLTGLAQPTYLDLFIQFDQYPGETSWTLTQDTIPLITSPNYGSPEYINNTIEQTLFLESGVEYTFTITDDFGDGICCGFGAGYFTLGNECEGLIIENLEFGDSIAEYIFTLGPCEIPPPVYGCTDETALNYNPEANEIYNGQIAPTSCNPFYPSNYNYFGIDLDYFNENQSAFAIGTEITVDGFTYYIDGTSTPNNCNAGVAMIYVVTDPTLADGNLFDTMQVGALFTDLYPEDTWEINPCEYIYGCNNPLAINYNPEATSNDGSCILVTGCMDPTALNYNPAAVTEFAPGIPGPPPCQYFVLDTTSCGVDSVELIVEITVDQYPQETSWNLITNWNEDQVVMEVLEGEYDGLTMGTTVTHTACVADNTNFTFRIFDSYGDGLGGSQWGGIDGEWIVYTACDTIASGVGNFGFNAMANGNTGDCDDLPIEGCMDDNYLEYNPEAVFDDGSCLTEKIYGCIDENSINYDENANTAEQFSNCSHTLNLTDLSANGWGGSFLMVIQGEDYYGPFTVPPGEALFTTEIDFNSNELIKAFFYTDPLSAFFANECGFEILSPSGEVIVFGGDNPILNPIRFSPFMYSGMGQCLETCIPIVEGCTDETACNYDENANTLSSCTYNIEYYDCNNQCNSDLDGDGVCDELEVIGCQDPSQYNFNILATDPGECEPFIYGCTDNTMFNFNPEANTDNNSCIPVIFGCIDETSFNYDPLANTNNDSCIPFVLGCTDATAFNYDIEANTDDNSCEDIVEGCTQSNQFNYNPDANTDDGSCYPFVYGCLNPNSYTYNDYDNDGVGNPLTGIDGVDVNTNNNLCVPFIYGCLDETAFNYNPDANTEDVNNPCEPFVYGCMDPTQFNYNVNANTDDGSCIEFVYGCTDELAFNYDPLANTNVGCESVIQGCTDPEAFNFNILANTDDGTCVDVVFGCTDETAFNYNPLANTNVGCESVVEGCTDEEAINYNPQANTDNGTCEAEVFGCTDPTAFNYDELANTDNGSCEEIIFGCLDETALNYNADANTDNGSCEEVVEGCMDPLALNYNELANVEDGSCIDAIYGCTDPTAFNYNELANADNGTCIEVVEGCTDPSAFNYNPEANTEDFSCIEVVYGCTDPQAANYDELANTDNGTCETVYANCIDPVVETYNLLDLESSCFAWVIDVSPSCCNNEWVDGCQTLYNYCDENTVTNVEEFGETQITVFPNPTRDIITIASSLNVNATLYNAIGQPIYQNNNVQQIDLSKYEAGIYNLILTYNDLQFTKKIVKQ